MSIKDIVVFTFSPSEDEAALAVAETLARDCDADLAAVLLELQPAPIYTMEGAMVNSLWAEVLADAHKGFAKDKADLEQRCRKSDRAIAIRELGVIAGLAASDAAMHARHADISVMIRPGGSGQPEYRSAIFEGVLFGSGRPVLLAPPDWQGDTIGKRILIAWNGKRESARALADAAPFLERGNQITVATIDAKPGDDGVGPSPGADIAAHLARHGLKVEVRNLDGLGRDEVEMLIAEAQAMEADLIVMGGYGRPRLSEMIFGGMTRSMASRSPVPVLMSH